MISNKPYLLRAFYEWIVDSQCTPLVTINVNDVRCIVPKEHIENGEITLNVSPDAVRDFKITNRHLEFRASFSGTVNLISAPIRAVQAIYAQENGEGMYFDLEEGTSGWEEEPVELADDTQTGSRDGSPPVTKKSASHLTVIK